MEPPKNSNKIITVHPYEDWIINLWRKKYRYGEITLIIVDGLPIRLRKAIINETPQDDKSTNK